MTVKIYNNSGAYNIYPVLTMGKDDPGKPDEWLQAEFKVPRTRTDDCLYHRAHNFRFYINPAIDTKTGKGDGIPPGGNVTITLPLYTQLVKDVTPKGDDQFIDWWNGGTIQIYEAIASTHKPPAAITAAYGSEKNPVSGIAGAASPACPACQPLKFFMDDSDLPKNDPSQLTEFTLGAKNPAPKEQPYAFVLDEHNVDFDISYVNVAHLPAAMEPVNNDQVGYVGTPQAIATFQTALNNFLKAPAFQGWPQFVDSQKKSLLPIPKLPSVLEVFARLTGTNAPADLTPLQPPQSWPNNLWPPIQALRTNWRKYAEDCSSGTCKPGLCQHSATGNKTFCDALLDVKKLFHDNYDNYVKVYRTNRSCDSKKKPVTLTESLMLSHVYGWSPFGENCTDARVNLLEETPGYHQGLDHAEYQRIKLEYDKLQYGKYTDTPSYAFDPWVVLIHGRDYVNAPNVYAYSVDDAVGNMQADADGFIIAVGGPGGLPNPKPATQPINVSIGYGGPFNIQFKSYRICKNDPSRDRPVNPAFASFIISANDPASCPVYFLDNKSPQQTYTFKLTTVPPYTLFTEQQVNDGIPKWNADTTAKWIDCTGNTGTPPFQPSSKTWCCDKKFSNGVWAYTTPDPHSAHRTQVHYVITTIPPQTTTTIGTACSQGQ
jgi:hypothetical protein